MAIINIGKELKLYMGLWISSINLCLTTPVLNTWMSIFMADFFCIWAVHSLIIVLSDITSLMEQVQQYIKGQDSQQFQIRSFMIILQNGMEALYMVMEMVS